MEILVGSTGFVGSNLANNHSFDASFHSTNIHDAFGLRPELCVYAGIRAEKFLANRSPEKDVEQIKQAIENIKKINPKKLVLISTIDVFAAPDGVDEDSPVITKGLTAYGLNRFTLEKWCAENLEDCHIIRLPGLFGQGIKKNLLYDLVHVIPSQLNEAKFKELSRQNDLIKQCFSRQENGFYTLQKIDEKTRRSLIDAFKEVGFTALHFTDSRAQYQFYHLSYLWGHIEIAIREKLRLLHTAVEPLPVKEIVKATDHIDFQNEIAEKAPYYNFKTKFAPIFGGQDGYIFDKRQVLEEITAFVEAARR